MFIRFVVSNFLSFSDESEFNMLSGNFKTHKHHVYDLGKISILKSAAIYGANGAGKSNLIKAIEFLQNTIKDGVLINSIDDKKFKLEESYKNKPTVFEIEFSIGSKIYSYGVSFNNSYVAEEWLYESGITKEDKLIFERKTSKAGRTNIKVSEKYRKTQKQKLLFELMEENFLKANELFLGKSDDLKVKEIIDVRSEISDNIVIIHPGSKFQNLVPALNSSERFKNFANTMMKTFDTGATELGIQNIDFEKYFGEDDEKLKKEIITEINNGHSVVMNTDSGGILITKENEKFIVKKVIANHKNKEGVKIPFDLNEESDGTQRLLDFIPAFDGVLNDQMCFIIDEIDQSLHPALLKGIIKKIMSSNETIGQLIFTTHESNLLDLDIFRQDEIWFCEKENKNGNSQLYSLSDFKPRYDLDIRKGYLKGRFGAIPFLANLEDLNWVEDYA